MRAAIRVTGGVAAAGMALAALSSATPASAQTRDGGVSTQAVKTYTGKFEHYDLCIEALGAKHWYLITDRRYKIGGNGGLYGPKGFIAYPGWKIKIRGVAHRRTGTTFCTTYVPDYYFKKATVWHP